MIYFVNWKIAHVHCSFLLSSNICCLLHVKNRHNSFKKNEMVGPASFDTCREEKLSVHRERAASG